IRIRDQVEIALPVADLDVFQSVPFFGQVEENLRKERDLFGVDAQFACARPEDVTVDADDVAEIENLVKFVFVFGNRVLADVDLDPFARLLDVHESGFAHAADGKNPAGDADLRLIR